MTTIKQLRQACKDAGIAYSGNDRKADLERKLASRRPPAPPAPSATTRVERIQLAKVESRAAAEVGWKMVRGEWTATREDAGERPPTPNLDAINAGIAFKPIEPSDARPSRRHSANPRYAAAQERARSGVRRGPGKKIAEEELEAWITAQRAADPALTRHQAEQVSYWVEGFSVGIDRFNRAWDRLVAAERAASGAA